MLRLICIFFIIANSVFSQSSHIKQPYSTQKLTNNYSPQFLRLLQIAFGNDEILSQGGIESVEQMFTSIDLNDKKILDVGSGFGGVAIYLAEHFNVEIIGVDMEPYMTSMAESYLEKHENSLLGKVSFLTLKEPYRLSEFKDESFDVIFSKEVFYNVDRAEKLTYLSEVYRKLKPGGILLIADWFQGKPVAGEALIKVSGNEKICQFVTPQIFTQMLEESHFQNITVRDLTGEHIRYTIEDRHRLAQNQPSIIQMFDEETYDRVSKSWQLWLEAQQADELLSELFTAKKSISRL